MFDDPDKSISFMRRPASIWARAAKQKHASSMPTQCAIDPTEGFKNEAGESMHGNLARAFAHLCGKLKCVWTELKPKQSKEH